MDSGFCKRVAVTLCLTAGVGCTSPGPECPARLQSGARDYPPSAGCFATFRGRLLMVQGLNGQVSLPGGSSRENENGRCTAFRETREETGLKLTPEELMTVFDTGFYLYRCTHHERSGRIDPPPGVEVKAAFYLAADQFDQYEWRYPEQQALLGTMLRDSARQH